MKNKFIVHQEESDRKSQEIINNSPIINNYQKKFMESTNINSYVIQKAKESEPYMTNFNIERNLNLNYEPEKIAKEQEELRNFPQIFESQNPSITISGIEYTTLLIPKMCVEKLKTILFG